MTGQGPDSDRTGPAAPPRATLSPREAARLAKVGRSSIMRAIAAHDLPARRDNRNQWQIEREALDRWRAARPAPVRAETTDPDRAPDRAPDPASPDHLHTLVQEMTEARAQATEERARADQLQIRLEERAALVRAAEARADRAEARAAAAEVQAAKLTDLLAVRPAPSPPPTPRRRWWLWRS